MKESDLYPPVRDWLRARGYEVHVEMFGADVVAVKDGTLTVVELKIALTQKLLYQCNDRARWADFVLAAVPVNMLTTREAKGRIKNARGWGFGVLSVDVDRCSARQIAKARQQPWGFHKRRNYRLKMLDGRPPAMDHELAGLPSCNALRQQRLDRNPRPTPAREDETR